VEPLDIGPECLRRTLYHAILLHQTQEELSLLREQQGRCAAAPPPTGEPTPLYAPLQE
jgi:hypothetical protein